MSKYHSDSTPVSNAQSKNGRNIRLGLISQTDYNSTWYSPLSPTGESVEDSIPLQPPIPPTATLAHTVPT